MPIHTITRVFSLNPVDNHEIEALEPVFDIHRKCVNLLIKLGMGYDFSLFERKTLISVKEFYDIVKEEAEVKEFAEKYSVKERLRRCAAQYAFFALKRHKMTTRKLEIISEFLIEEDWPNFDGFRLSYWKPIQKKRKDRFPRNQLLNKVRDCYIKRYQAYDGLKNTSLGNRVRAIRNRLYQNLKDHAVDISTKEFKRRVIQEIQERYSIEFLDYVLKKYLRTASLHLTKSYKKYMRTGNKNKLLTQFLEQSDIDISDQTTWDNYRKEWRDRQYEMIKQILDTIKLDKMVEKVQVSMDEETQYSWHMLFYDNYKYPRVDRLGLEGFFDFIQSIILTHVIKLSHLYFKDTFNGIITQMLANFASNIDNWVDTPFFDGRTISLAIDDGQIYQIEYNHQTIDIILSFIPYQSNSYSLSSPSRFFQIIGRGYKPKRGVLKLEKGKLKLYLPFSKRIAEVDNPSDRVVGVDLGLKTFATLSLFDGDREIDRQFLDQKQLVGPKNEWFDKSKQYDNVPNHKRNLIMLQERANRLRSQMYAARKRYKKKTGRKDYTSSMKYWKIKREWKYCWNKISRIHYELVNQISTRIISYCDSFNVGCIHFEDLSWSRHSSKRKVNYFLTSWQIHWFHSQIQQKVEHMALVLGIEVKRVDARNTSKRCSKCGELGNRSGKQFHCIDCGLQLDSDLNAARNIAVNQF